MQSSKGPPQSIEHRGLTYHYTAYISQADGPPHIPIVDKNRQIWQWTPRLKPSVTGDHALADKCL